MTQQAMDDRMTKAQEYLRHQGAKSLGDLGASDGPDGGGLGALP